MKSLQELPRQDDLVILYFDNGFRCEAIYDEDYGFTVPIKFVEMIDKAQEVGWDYG